MTDSNTPRSSIQSGAAQEPVVVVLGGSAGTVSVLEDILNGFEESEGVALVVTVHQPEAHESALDDVLERMTSLPVRPLDGSASLQGGAVYVVPPAHVVDLDDSHGDRLVAAVPDDEQTKRAPIDRIFRNLSTLRERLAAVVLSGTGADGAVGIRSVKEHGGLVIAQDPDEAEHAGMPSSAIRTDMVDFVLPASEIGPQVARHRCILQKVDPYDEVEDGNEETLQKIFTQVRARTGHDFSQYKRSTMLRRIGRRMQVNQCTSLDAYLAFLRQSNEEARSLLKDLLITVTNFFRDPEAFEALGEQVIPNLFEDKTHDDQVRAWVAGCATGEEAYSVAMLLIEHAETRNVVPDVQVFATDLDEDALSVAREGRYPESIEGDVSKKRLKRFFSKEGSDYVVSRQLREHVIFAPVSTSHRIFQRVTDSSGGQYVPSLPFRAPQIDVPVSRQEGRKQLKDTLKSPFDRHANLMETAAPPSIVVDADFQMVHLSESAGRYLQHPGGAPSRDVVDHVRPELQSDLYTALQRAFSHGTRRESKNLTLNLRASCTCLLCCVYC